MSAGAAHLGRSAGRVWFEVEVLETSFDMVVGFAGSNFREGQLGADERGWGIVKSGAAKHRREGEWEGSRVRCGRVQCMPAAGIAEGLFGRMTFV